MSVPERTPEATDHNREVDTVDRTERREARLEPVERERYVTQTRLVDAGPVFRWGPIWAGAVVAFGVLFLLGSLGTVLGLAAVRTTTPSAGQLGTASLIWAAVILVVSFFMGGWVAGRATGHPDAGVSGFVVGSVFWAFAVTAAVLLTAFGVGGAAAAALGTFGIPPINPSGGALTAAQTAAIGTLVGLVLAYLASIAGAAAGVAASPRRY